MLIQLVWTDTATGAAENRQIETPIALGRDPAAMPEFLDGMAVAKIVLSDGLVSAYHALIRENNGEVIAIDQNSSTGIEINDVSLPSSTLLDGDRLRIGSILFLIRIGSGITPGGCDKMVGFLFKRRCSRSDPTGCPHCQGGRVDPENSNYEEYAYYSGYGRYDSWGRSYYERRDDYYYNPATDEVDFTEADAEALVAEGDADFETDMGAS